MKPSCPPSAGKPSERSMKEYGDLPCRGVARTVLGDEGVGNQLLANVGRIADDAVEFMRERSQREVVACQPDVREPFRGCDAPPRQEGNDLRARRRKRSPLHALTLSRKSPQAFRASRQWFLHAFDSRSTTARRKIAFPERRFRNPPSMQRQIRSVAEQVGNEIDDLPPGEDRSPFLDSWASEIFERLFDRARSRQRSLPRKPERP